MLILIYGGRGWIGRQFISECIKQEIDYVEGTASSIANELSLATGKRVYTLGLEPRTAGFHPTVDNLPPTAEKILEKLKQIKNGI